MRAILWESISFKQDFSANLSKMRLTLLFSSGTINEKMQMKHAFYVDT